jgi:hypothetical protein
MTANHLTPSLVDEDQAAAVVYGMVDEGVVVGRPIHEPMVMVRDPGMSPPVI